MSDLELVRELTIRNHLGMHARAAVRFVQIAKQFSSEVQVKKNGDEVNGKSVMGLLTLVAAHGMKISVITVGDDAAAAMAALSALVESGFGEGVDGING